MAKKLNNLTKFWLESGFYVRELSVREDKGKIYEIDVYLEAVDGQSFKLIDVWDLFIRTANRQSFYVIPTIGDKYKEPTKARVLLIPKEALIKANRLWKSILLELSESYWYIQSDTDIVDLFPLANKSMELARSLQSDIYNMYSSTPAIETLSTNTTYHNWVEYKVNTFDLFGEIDSLDKVSDNIKDSLNRLVSMYELVNRSV